MKKSKVTNFRYTPGYHVYSRGGWINDPNGLIYYQGYYHVFFQYYPYDSKWGPMHWGHRRSKDLVHWEELPVALTPTDEEGCFSGSAVVYKDKLCLIYTAHHVIEIDGKEQVFQDQCLATSDDGVNFTKYEGNPIISLAPEDNSEDFRDPKVWDAGGIFKLVVGSRTKDNLGRVLLYESVDLKNWIFKGEIARATTATDEGYMWECPDLFRLNGEDVLIMSPQGIKPREGKFKNLHQTGYLIGKLKNNYLAIPKREFKELDLGHDFYAAQTFLAPDGRRLLIAWMDMWEKKLPEQADGWAGMLTFPRELILKGETLYMQPVAELAKLRSKLLAQTVQTDWQLELPARRLELQISAHTTFTLEISYGQEKLKLSKSGEVLTLEKTDADKRTTIYENNKTELQILMDTSSVEIFVKGGPTFSERLYGSKNTKLTFQSEKQAEILVYKLEVWGENKWLNYTEQ